MAIKQPYVAISNHFNYSPIKNRIMMLNKKSSKKWAMLKYASIVPAVLVLLLLSQESAANKWSNAFNDKENTVEQTIMQTTAPQSVVTKQKHVQKPGQLPDSVLMKVENMPEFEGGKEALYAFFAKNLRYPQKAKEDSVSGRVWLSFVVKKDGYVDNVKVLRGIGAGCDEEAVRVIQAMPKWKPGTMKDGTPVNVQYQLPINFALPKK